MEEAVHCITYSYMLGVRDAFVDIIVTFRYSFSCDSINGVVTSYVGFAKPNGYDKEPIHAFGFGRVVLRTTNWVSSKPPPLWFAVLRKSA